jgi:dihydrofolate synthase/folylpolyglutamate synthase
LDYRESIDRLLSLVDHETGGVHQETPPLAQEMPGPAADRQHLPRQKQIFNLDRIEALLRRLGSPHQQARTVHVAGTKGKGSTAAMCDAVLHAAGYRTGFYSSPHLHSFRERIRLNTQPVSEERFGSLVGRVWPHLQDVTGKDGLAPVTLFEALTAMGFYGFADAGVEYQTIEVGLGGRLDATNVVEPAVCVITPVSYDHTAILGDSLGQIAREKAGIIKPDSTVVIAPQEPEAREALDLACLKQGARPIYVGRDVTWQAGARDASGQELVVGGRLDEYRVRIPLLGLHQLENTAAAVAALEVLREQGCEIPRDALAQGLASVSWPCRMEVLSRSPLVVADGAHNLHSMESLLASLPHYLGNRRLLAVVGFSRDKSVEDMVRCLAQTGPVVFATASRHPRSLAPRDIARQFAQHGIAAVETSSPKEALERALEVAGAEDLVLATGSLFVAAEVREAVLGIAPEVYPDLLPLRGRGLG